MFVLVTLALVALVHLSLAGLRKYRERIPEQRRHVILREAVILALVIPVALIGTGILRNWWTYHDMTAEEYVDRLGPEFVSTMCSADELHDVEFTFGGMAEIMARSSLPPFFQPTRLEVRMEVASRC